MIQIRITKTTMRSVEVEKNFLISEEIAALENNWQSPNTKKNYETRTVKEDRSETITLLEQQVIAEHEETFDLNAVIIAINQIGASK